MVMMNYLDQYQHLSRRLVGGNRGGSYHLTFTAFLTKIPQQKKVDVSISKYLLVLLTGTK